jgi:multidrug efflux system membrane fusion protein
VKPFWIVFIVLGAAAGGGYYWWNHQAAVKSQATEASAGAEGKAKGKKGRGGPVSVRTIAPKRLPMPVLIDAVGTVEPLHSVAVHPQVSGVLTAVRFKEGDYVQKGQVLFEIDHRPMQAAVEQSQAAVRRDEAQLAQARAQEERLRSLVDKDYITRQEYDVAATTAKSLEATVNANRAALEQAKLQLAYSRIVAPISGRTGSLGVRAGNLVSAGTGGLPLVVINSTRPILVAIPVPQRYLEDVRKNWGSKDLKVEIAADRGEQTLVEGKMVFIDNAVNPSTGTILLKAEVANDKEQLWPGQFLAARIVLQVQQDAMVLPERAIQPGQEGPFVFVVSDGRARVKDVVVDRQVGEQVVVAAGLEGNEQVIVEVPPTLAANSPVVLAGEGGKGTKGGRKSKGKSKDNADAALTGAPVGDGAEPSRPGAAKVEERP